MELTTENVYNIFMECLYKPTDKRLVPIRVKGITIQVGFHPERLKEHKADIIDMLEYLPDSFRKDGGGGMSFLNMCVDKNGRQWTGLHEIMENLLLLGLAIEQLSFLLPRELWKALPEGMPYIIISD